MNDITDIIVKHYECDVFDQVSFPITVCGEVILFKNWWLKPEIYLWFIKTLIYWLLSFSVKEQVYELGFQQYQCTVKLKTNIVNLDFSYGISINALNVSGWNSRQSWIKTD